VQKLQSSINAALGAEASGQTPDVTVGTDKDGVVIRLSGSYLFDSGRAELKPNSMKVLDAIANELKLLPNEIRVDGHTDSIPLTNSPLYATNWELSAARAVTVARYFSQTDGIQASRLIAAGFGEYHPIVPNDTREHRAQNRRVEIHVLSSTVEDPTQVMASPAGTTLTPTPTGATEYLEP
jgi:chemotaxis protein MotB